MKTKHIKLFEDYHNKYKTYLQTKGFILNSYDDIFKYSAKEYVKYLGYEGFEEEEDAIEYMNNFLNSDFPKGLRNISNKITLYRLLALKDINDIDINDFGTHFVADKSILNIDFVYTIGLEDVVEMTDVKYEDTKLYIITVEIEKTQIDFFQTLHNRMFYPTEQEFTTIKNPKFDIKNIEILEI